MTQTPQPPDEIDALFDVAATEADAIASLEAAVTMLRQAREAKTRLARLDTQQLRDRLLARSRDLGVEPA